MKVIFARVAVFIFFFYLGLSVVQTKNSFFLSSRDPAAVQNSIDFSHLQGRSLNEAMKERVVAGIQIHKEAKSVGLSLGHFTMKSVAGDRTLACREFEKVAFHFVAEGISFDGEKPTMKVEGNCDFTDDLAHTKPFMIPFESILASRPADGEFQFMEQSSVHISFANLFDQWPRQWVLVKVEFIGAKNQFSIERDEIQKKFGHLIAINFPQ